MIVKMVQEKDEEIKKLKNKVEHQQKSLNDLRKGYYKELSAKRVQRNTGSSCGRDHSEGRRSNNTDNGDEEVDEDTRQRSNIDIKFFNEIEVLDLENRDILNDKISEVKNLFEGKIQ